MNHELRLTTYEDMVIPAVVPEMPRRQMAAEPPLDLNRASLDYGLSCLGALKPDESAYLVAMEGWRETAMRLGKEFRLPVILLPPEMCANGWVWALVAGNGTFYSTPIP